MDDWVSARGRIYWYDQYALNDQETAFAAYDPERVAQDLISTGADIVALYAANQFSVAYYPSAIWPQHPNLKGRDYFGEVSARLRAAGKKVIAYINWLESRHPEWQLVPLGREDDPSLREFPLASWADAHDAERRVQQVPGGQWRVCCVNSPRRDQVLRVAEEILSRYRPDGFHLDMLLNTEVCVCPYCRPTLERICGGPVTQAALDAHWREYIDWRHESSACLLRQLTELAHRYGALAVHNGFAPATLPALWGPCEQWLPSLDVFLSECFDAFLIPCTDLNTTSINVRWQHAVGKPSWILRTSTTNHFGHWPITKAHWLLHAAACKANGCQVFGPCGVGAYPDTTSSKRLLENVKAGFDAFMADADLCVAAQSAARVALMFSWNTRAYSESGAGLGWCEEFVGWARLLIEEHLPYDIVVAETITSAEALAQYDLVLLPGIACMDDAACALVDQYVANGGRVVATADTSLKTATGEARDQFGLARTLGVAHEGFAEGPLAIERSDEAEPASGTLQRVATQARVLTRAVDVDPRGSVFGGEDPQPLHASAWPLLTENVRECGGAYYVAFNVGAYYERHGDTHIAEWMAEIVDQAMGTRQIEVKAPRTVEVTLWRQAQPDRYVIHLANRTVPWSLPTDARQIGEIIPVHDIEIRLQTPFSAPVVSGRHTAVDVVARGGEVVVRVARVEDYAAILIEESTA